MLIFLLLLLLPIVIPVECQEQSSCSDMGSDNFFACEVVEAKLKVNRLESLLERRIDEINARVQHFGDLEKKVEELNAEIGRLNAALSGFEHDRSISSQKIASLEEEVKLLWAASRRNNFEIYSLEAKAADADRRLKQVRSKVEAVNDIVTEQWIQIQRLEQAVYMTKMRTLKVMELWRKCPFIKFFIDVYADSLKAVKEILKPYGPRYKYMAAWCNYRASQAFAVAKDFHHQLQGFVREAMQSNDITGALAHEELVFFVASALVALPVMAACLALLSQFN